MPNLVLIGGRAVGKTTLSRQIANQTGMPLFSTDNLVQFLSGGKPIREIIASQGWPHFRQLELKVVEKISAFDNAIIDCGGGVITELDDAGNSCYSERKVALLKENGVVLWLDAPLLVQQQWLSTDDRPALSEQGNATAELESIMQIRRPWYEQACDYRIQINESGFGQIAEQIISLYQSHDATR